MPKKTDKIIEPIDASFDLVADAVSSTKKSTQSQLHKALYVGVLPIGNVKLDCAVLEDGSRILTASSVFAAFERPRRANSRLEISGIKMPAFMDAKNLEPFINQSVMRWIIPVEYLDGKTKKKGYVATILPKMCEVYLNARRAGVLTESQEKLATQSEILLLSLAQVGIDALIDEATGFQIGRKHDALRLLLSIYKSGNTF